MNFFRANKNFSWLLLGRIITNIGDSLYYIAATWLVYDLGGSAFYSGLAGFLILFPKVLQFLFGPFIDRWHPKKILTCTQLLQCILLLMIPCAYFFNLLTIQFLLIIMPLIAIIEQFSYPTQNKLLPLVLKKEDLLKGNTYFSFAYQGIDLIFNAFAGILVALIGAISLFLVDSITFATCAMIFSLLKLSHLPIDNTPVKHSYHTYIKELSEGLSLVFKALLPLLAGAIAINFTIGATYALLPSFAEEKGGAHIYGYYLTSISAGLLLGAWAVQKLGKFKVGRLTIYGYFLTTCLWVFSALVPNTILSVLLFGLAWIPIGYLNIFFGTLNQIIIPNELLGRVTSASYSLSALSLPFGSLIGGFFTTAVNNEIMFMLTGAGSLIAGLIWLMNARLRNLPEASKINHETFPIGEYPKEIQARETN
ncbi:MFS transporter [Pradoshia eiseniae]|uniref:MFS transporter n=1 Tax=Pradoshia eiseniae TaxID=2064768 RepID=A0A2S7N400_9BACI|nr:MFS transporter [Pradoshia eiseniae]PQD96690.1 MFS transporter [Pradoshia eiseniae]